MPRHTPSAALIAATLLAGAVVPTFSRAANEAAAKPPAAPARFSVKAGTCSEFLALPAELRGLLVAWTAGRYNKLDRWVMDEAIARSVIAGVEQQCGAAPGAAFRYKVVDEVKKVK
jgi:hypothetical protein